MSDTVTIVEDVVTVTIPDSAIEVVSVGIQGPSGSASVGDATTTSKGLVQLAGDLAGTASAPTVPALASKASTTTTITAGTGLTGGGDLSASRTISASFGTTAGTIAQGNDSRITGAEQTVNKGVANGYAGLDATGKVPSAQLPTSAAVSDATTTSKGIVQLAGDLGGTAASPTVPGLTSKADKTYVDSQDNAIQSQVTSNTTAIAGKEPAVAAGTTSQYYRGDKTFQTLDKTAVGLANVDNTSDASKPISTATQTALNAKAAIAGQVFTGAISATNLSGTNTGDQTTITGNAGTATTLQTPRNINGTPFDGSADITISDSTKVAKSGDTMTGNLTSRSLEPASNASYNLGTTNYYSQSRIARMYANATAYIDGSTPGQLAVTGVPVISGVQVSGGSLEWQPGNQNLKAWNYDIATTSNANSRPATGGVLMIQRLYLPVATTVTNIHLGITATPTSLTTGQNFAALYSSTGTLIAQTADQTTAWGSTGLITMPLSGGPYTVQPGYIYTAFWCNGTTAPGFLRNFFGAASLANVGCAANAYRWASAGSGNTTTAPTSLGAQSADGNGYWVAIS